MSSFWIDFMERLGDFMERLDSFMEVSNHDCDWFYGFIYRADFQVWRALCNVLFLDRLDGFMERIELNHPRGWCFSL